MRVALVAAAIASSAFLPPDDPGFRHCLDPSQGIRLDWPAPADGVHTYLLVKRQDGDGTWRPWLKTERARPPFTLTLHGALPRRSRFAWMVFEVEGNERTEGRWRYFCTETAEPGNAPGG